MINLIGPALLGLNLILIPIILFRITIGIYRNITEKEED